MMLVSIVLPAYNEEETIENCLESLIRQSYEQKEIIVVNDGSTDNTQEIIDRIKHKQSIVNLINIEHSGRSHARNEGLRISSGELVLFAEADAKYHPDYLTRAAGSFKDPLINGVLVEGEVWGRETLISRCMQAEVKLRNADLRSGRAIPKSAWVYRRDALTTLGGFDENLEAGEDRDLGIRLRDAGHTIRWVEGVSWWFKSPETLSDLLARSLWFGKEEIQGFYKKYPEKYPWSKLLFALLCTSLLLSGIINSTGILWVTGLGLAVILLKILSILLRGKGVVEMKYAVALGFLAPIRFIFFFIGNILGFFSLLWNILRRL